MRVFRFRHAKSFMFIRFQGDVSRGSCQGVHRVSGFVSHSVLEPEEFDMACRNRKCETWNSLKESCKWG